MGRLRPRSARGQFQAKPERLCFFSVILVTHPKSYIETTDRRNVKMEVRTGAIVKNPGIL